MQVTNLVYSSKINNRNLYNKEIRPTFCSNTGLILNKRTLGVLKNMPIDEGTGKITEIISQLNDLAQKDTKPVELIIKQGLASVKNAKGTHNIFNKLTFILKRAEQAIVECSIHDTNSYLLFEKKALGNLKKVLLDTYQKSIKQEQIFHAMVANFTNIGIKSF